MAKPAGFTLMLLLIDRALFDRVLIERYEMYVNNSRPGLLFCKHKPHTTTAWGIIQVFIFFGGSNAKDKQSVLIFNYPERVTLAPGIVINRVVLCRCNIKSPTRAANLAATVPAIKRKTNRAYRHRPG